MRKLLGNELRFTVEVRNVTQLVKLHAIYTSLNALLSHRGRRREIKSNLQRISRCTSVFIEIVTFSN